MTNRQITLVQESFEHVRPISEVAAELFYTRLFEIAPEVRPMFKGDMKEQGRKLMTMLNVVVKGLSAPEKIIPAAQQLGVRHVDYGVRDEHYPIVAEALLWTLEQGLKEAWTPEVKEAWVAAYTLLAGVMTQAAAAGDPLPTA
jgi:hemoglobin-like flavoprotein